MEKKKRNGLIIGTILLLGTGIAAYFYLKPKGDKKGEEKSDDKGGETKPPVNTTSPINPISSNDEPSNVLDFQKFANSNGWSPKLVLDGIYGSKTKAAWGALSKKYLDSIAPKPAAPQLKSANDVLSYNINGLNSVALYANKNATVFNMAGVKAYTANAGSLLGIGTSGTRKSGNGYIVYFMKGNVKYWTISDNIGIK